VAITVSLNGADYTIPEVGDANWAAGLTLYLQALATAFPQTGGSVGFTALTSATVNPADAGQIRLAKTDLIEIRNYANSGNNMLGTGAGVSSLTSGPTDELFYKASGGSAVQVTGQCYVRAHRGGSAVTGISAATTVLLDTEDADTDNAYDPTTGIFTCPAGKGGQYVISASLATSQAGSTGNQVLNIVVNSTQVAFGGAFAVTSGGTSPCVSAATVIALAAGDTVKLQLSTSAGTCGYLQSAGCSLGIKRLV
jgi:hypothetical protein